MTESQLLVLDADGAIPITDRWRDLLEGEVVAISRPRHSVALYPPHAFANASEACWTRTPHNRAALARARRFFGSAVYLQPPTDDRIELPPTHQQRLGGPGTRVKFRRVSNHVVLRPHRRWILRGVHPNPRLCLVPLVALLIPAALLGLGALTDTASHHNAGSHLAPRPHGQRHRASSGFGCLPGPGTECGPIHYVLNPAGSADPSFAADVHEAVRRISRTSKVEFVFDGVTTEVPATNRAAYQAERYGKRWAPLLIAWTTEPTIVSPVNPLPSAGRPTCKAINRRSMYVSGQVALRSDALLSPGFGTRNAWGSVIMRDVVRALGIPYTGDPADILYNGLNPFGSATWGRGDKSALQRLAANDRCTP